MQQCSYQIIEQVESNIKINNAQSLWIYALKKTYDSMTLMC